ncbi:MAG: radical SAM protein [Pseudomonadota bacterium]
MKAVLVRPPFYALFGVTTPKMKTYPLNLLSLATYARDVGGHDVVLVDGENVSVPDLVPPEGAASDPETVMHDGIPRMIRVLEDHSHPLWLELERRIMDENPDLVGISCNSGNMDTARVMVGRLKAHGVPVVLGGSHPTVLPEQSLAYTSADMAVMGEGETALVAILDSTAGKGDFRDTRSLAWNQSGHIHINPRGELIDNIDELPIPDRSFIDRSHYFGEVVMTSRGCPFDCAYCASRNIWGKRVRFRSLDSLLKELKMLKAAAEDPGQASEAARPGSRVVKVIDDTFTLGKKRTLDFLQALIGEGLNCFEFTGGVRVDTLDEEIAATMHEAGFRRVTLGVESGSPKILRMIRKGTTNDRVKRAVELLRNAGIKSHAFFMIGFPEETREDVEMSKQLIREARPDYVEVNMVTPYPGTWLFDELISEDPMKIDRWYRWFHQGLSTHSDKIGFDLDRAYEDFLRFAKDHNSKSAPTHSKGR